VFCTTGIFFLFTTALGLYGGVLWSGELQGIVIHEMMPSWGWFFLPNASAHVSPNRFATDESTHVWADGGDVYGRRDE
jgi:hypothetical protein